MMVAAGGRPSIARVKYQVQRVGFFSHAHVIPVGAPLEALVGRFGEHRHQFWLSQRQVVVISWFAIKFKPVGEPRGKKTVAVRCRSCCGSQ